MRVLWAVKWVLFNIAYQMLISVFDMIKMFDAQAFFFLILKKNAPEIASNMQKCEASVAN